MKRIKVNLIRAVRLFEDVNKPPPIKYEQTGGPELQKIVVEHKSGGQVRAQHPMSIVCSLCENLMPSN